MALVIGRKKTRKFRVQIKEAGDFSAVKEHTADIEFRLLSRSEIQEIRDLANEENEGHDSDLAVSKIFDSIVSLEGLKEESGEAIPYDDEVRQFIIDTPWISIPVMRAFWSVQSGVTQTDAYKQAKLKN